MIRAKIQCTGWTLLLCAATSASAQTAGIRTPSFAADGRLAFSAGGDLLVMAPAGSGAWGVPVLVTAGPAWDRDPAWAPDGTLVFASDRSGTTDIWRVAAEAGAVAVRITAGVEHDMEPTVSANGDIVFARGWAGDTDLWLRTAAGTERRLTDEPGAERQPAWSPDGTRVAYVAVRAGTRELRVRSVEDGSETTLTGDAQVSAPAWAPDGERLVYAGGGSRGGLHVVSTDGSYMQTIGTEPGAAAWSPDGGRIVFADLDGGDGGYNGDPDRLGERLAGDATAASGGLREVPAPSLPRPPAELSVASASTDAGAAAGATYDRVWNRLARLYYGYTGVLGRPDEHVAPGEPEALRAWRATGTRHRAAAVAARDEAALQDAIWSAVRDRPRRSGARGRAGVSSAHPLATSAGIEILELGGNVVDAAVAVSFALGVVEPDASGIGGYGEMLIQLEGMTAPVAIEFMTRVPEAATLDNPAVSALPRSGPGVANVPGTVAGMELAWRKHGSGVVTWAQLLEPAIRLAERGFELDDGFATTLRRERARFAEHESSRALFFRDGSPLGVGDTLRNPDLASVLRQIAAGGAAALYTGELGRLMVEDLRAGGNLMTVEDMRRYLAQERVPVHTTYRGNDVYSGPPPVTGGAVLAGKLNLLEREPVGGLMTEDAATLHRMIEAWRFQPSTSGRIADPDLWPVDITPFESKDTAAARWRCYSSSRASVGGALNRADCGRTVDSDGVDSNGVDSRAAEVTIHLDAAQASTIHSDPGEAAPRETCLANDRDCAGTGTTAYVVADAAGNIVSVTQTLGTWGGNFYVSPGLGFLYNDKLRSYGSNPAGYNARIPYARNTTVISPTIVFRGSGASREPWFGVGAAGNAWITAAVYTMVVGIVDHGLGAQAALELPRFLAGGGGVQIENGFAPSVLRELESMGHTFNPISLLGELRMGYGAAVVIDGAQVEAGGDPRRGGTGMAVRAAGAGGGR